MPLADKKESPIAVRADCNSLRNILLIPPVVLFQEDEQGRNIGR